MKISIVPAGIAAAITLCLPASAVEFYPIVSVSSDRAATDFFPSERLIEGAGIGFDAAEPHDRTSGLTWVTDAPNGGTGDFFNPPQIPAARLVFDLGDDVVLSEISYWGYADTNANGANEFNLRFATAAEGDAGFGTSITYNPVFTPTQPVTPRQSFEFSQAVVARYIELTPTDNFFGINPPGGDRVGMGEIAFQVAMSVDPNISVPAELALDLDADDPTDFNVPVTNSGEQDLIITATALTGTNASAFTIVTVTSPVESLTTENIAMQFDPTGLGGAVSATLQITSNDPDMPTVEVLLTGTLPEFDPDISTPAEVALTAGGAAQTLAVPVANTGRAQLNMSGTSLSGPNAAAFTVTSAPASIAALSSADIQVAFDPTGISGSLSATLQIDSNDPDTPMAQVLLTGGVGATFFAISSATSTTAGTDLFSVENLIQGSGTGFDSAFPHDALGAGAAFTWVTNAPNGGVGDYFNPLPVPAPVIVFDLGQDVPLGEVSFWGYADTNANGANKFSLRFATSAEGPINFGNSIVYNPTFEPIQDTQPRQSFAFEETAFARYVEWTPLDNFFGINPPGGDRIGAGEIAFEITGAIPGNQFAVTSIKLIGGEVVLNFKSRPGLTYGIFRSTDLTGWEELDDSYASGGETTEFIDENVPAGSARVFYQIRIGQG